MSGSDRIYWAPIVAAQGKVSLSNPDRKIDTKFHGDMLIKGHSDGNKLFVQEIRRFSKASELLTSLGGVISMSGPCQGPRKVSPPADRGKVSFNLHLYYPELQSSDGLSCIPVGTSGLFPPLKQVICEEFRWKPGSLPNSLDITLRFTFPDDKTNGRLFKVVFEREIINLPFQPIADADDNLHEYKALRVRFVILAKNTPPETLRKWIKNWLDEAEKVWTDKGGLTIIKKEIIEHPDYDKKEFPDNPKGFVVTPNTYSSIGQISRPLDVDAITIYLIDRFEPDPDTVIFRNLGNKNDERHDGGFTYCGGTDNAYTVLDVDYNKEKEEGGEGFNEYLLAHELGHVLGLLHPEQKVDGDEKFLKSSKGSIMQAGSHKGGNTRQNLRALEEARFPMSKVLVSQRKFDQWNPDD
jgi:hypothetical protein